MQSEISAIIAGNKWVATKSIRHIPLQPVNSDVGPLRSYFYNSIEMSHSVMIDIKRKHLIDPGTSMKHIFLFIIVAIVLTAISCNSDGSDNSTYIEPNTNIIQSKGFNVRSESTDLETSVRGTVFLSGSDGQSDHAHIVAWIEIDPDDWGGVAFYIPDGWTVTSKTSSYPEDVGYANPANHIAQWNTTTDKYGYDCFVEIGRDRSGPTSGGIGSVMIELDATKQVKTSSEVFSIVVAVGCDEKNGVKTVHPDSEIVEVSIQRRDKLS